MGDHHVTTGVAAGACGCGCGQPLPAPPPGGGRLPVYASRACQRHAARPAPAAPADPPTVAALIRDIRELAGAPAYGISSPASAPPRRRPSPASPRSRPRARTSQRRRQRASLAAHDRHVRTAHCQPATGRSC
ncbi:hypothetical protein [Candidatus Frankia alpina]|uniref:Uncharacterized protein n=1 Tax=Candidatus Frankia alpina TaxID=2699483 RepID=A0A4S5DYE1_9ACTN|nr:hypothetical protein [Candidatus Frankia alpina]THJ63972.1 hypothetical protein E7Y31_17905 [Candidatus Frankia alpina]